MPHPNTVEVDLACLDHGYFLEEIGKLETIAASVGYQIENAPTQNNTSSKVYVAHSNPEDVHLLIGIGESLSRLRFDMEQQIPFDPQHILSELYSVETALKDLKHTHLSRSTGSGGQHHLNRSANNLRSSS
eukprot:gene12171-14246_t